MTRWLSAWLTTRLSHVIKPHFTYTIFWRKMLQSYFFESLDIFFTNFFLSGLDEGHLKCNLGGFISLPKGKLIKLFHVTKGRVARISSFGPSNLIAHSIDKLKRFKSLSPASLYVYQINL